MPTTPEHYHLTLKAHPVKYQPDPIHYFTQIHGSEGAILLDSGTPSPEAGRFDFMSALPIATLITNQQGKAFSPQHPELTGSIIEAQRQLLDRLHIDENSNVPEDIPFNCGLIGAWSYNSGRFLEGLPASDGSTDSFDMLPTCWIGLYTWVLVQDHAKQVSYIIADETQLGHIISLFNVKPNNGNDIEPFRLTSAFSPVMPRNAYHEAFKKIKSYITAGDCYQVNLTQAFSATYAGSEWHAYHRLRQATLSPFSAYLNTGGIAPFHLLSVSPERFISVNQGNIITQPIKGTRPRGHTPEEDSYYARELENSRKDLAENVMIVDLLRNDIGRVASLGSIRVAQLAKRIAYANVHHLVSTIEGHLAAGQDTHDLLAASLPGGSITGAPKHRAMEIIDEIEACGRSYYCGSIGYIDYRGNMDTSITIRTAVITNNNIRIWGGGGIVSDSIEAEEYEESIIKIKRLMAALESNAC
ncbi:Aminodeoxychorismate synthase component 1 [Halomonadaceae bacterium LMG 33818]|uniref:aminodeoxychorismate synthase component I n=1 Tax=Cernens ardua TaxID=3402176 RepID=UPI003EDB9CD4